jgi:hypothetical protein
MRSNYPIGAMISAQTSIGFIASASPQATRYLIQGTRPSFWTSLPWDDPRTSSELHLAMSEASIRALGLSGAPEAGQALARLRQWPYNEAQRGVIKEAMEYHHRYTLMRKWEPHYRNPSSLRRIREILAPVSDSMSLVGQWRWVRSTGWGANYVPPASGWSRTLVVQGDSSFSFWEFDSAGSYRLCSGRLSIHDSAIGRAKGSWIEVRGWPDYRVFWLRYAPPYLLLMPGSPRGPFFDRGLTFTFTREIEPLAPSDTISASAWRPPRLIRSLESPHYWIELPDQLQAILYGMLRDRWTSSRRNVPNRYSYTHYQIPAGVIGDFDGDSLADVALYGYDEGKRNTVVCVLSNGGSPQGRVVWRESTKAKRRDESPSSPNLYLERCPRGEWVADPAGIQEVLAADGIYVTTVKGERSIYYYADGDFRHGTPAVAIRR